MNENEKIAFEAIANVENAKSGSEIFIQMVGAYAGKIGAVRLLGTSAERVEGQMTMGEYLLVELAMATFGVPFAEAATIVRRNLRAVRHNLHIVNQTDEKLF